MSRKFFVLVSLFLFMLFIIFWMCEKIIKWSFIFFVRRLRGSLIFCFYCIYFFSISFVRKGDVEGIFWLLIMFGVWWKVIVV